MVSHVRVHQQGPGCSGDYQIFKSGIGRDRACTWWFARFPERPNLWEPMCHWTSKTILLQRIWLSLECVRAWGALGWHCGYLWIPCTVPSLVELLGSDRNICRNVLDPCSTVPDRVHHLFDKPTARLKMILPDLRQNHQQSTWEWEWVWNKVGMVQSPEA